jgi:hypothetical protein
MFEQAKRLIAVDGFASVTVERTFVSFKKIHKVDGEIELSFQMEFNFSQSAGFSCPDFEYMNTAERWQYWRNEDHDYRSIFCKVIYEGEVPTVPNLKLLTASGGLALGELEVDKQDLRKAACYFCQPHQNFRVLAKGRKARQLEIEIDTKKNLLF